VSLESHLRARRDAGHKLLVPYITGGLGDDWMEVLHAIADAGADAVEIGIPFSDPMMDGVTIQEASRRALEQGATPAGIIAAVGSEDFEVPLAVMTYANPVAHMGFRRFAAALAGSRIAGAIVPDLPLDELDGWADAADAAGVETVLLAAPNTPDERLDAICRRSRGFVYGVALMGVTGARDHVATQAGSIAQRCKAVTDKPVLLGFGISTPEHAVEASALADGVIVASALIARLLDGGGPEAAHAFVSELRRALDESTRA
jgi:tryptophan synthase alpha chain